MDRCAEMTYGPSTESVSLCRRNTSLRMVSMKGLMLLTAYILLQESYCQENERNLAKTLDADVVQMIHNQIYGMILNSNNQPNETSFEIITNEKDTNSAANETDNKNKTVKRGRRSHEIPSFIFHKGREGVRNIDAECSRGNGCKQPDSKSSASFVLPNIDKTSENKLIYNNGPKILEHDHNNREGIKNTNKIINNGLRRTGRNENDEEYESYLPEISTEKSSIRKYTSYNQDNSYTQTTERLYPVYIPDDSRQKEGRSRASSENDGRNSNFENSRDRIFTQEPFQIHISDNNSEQNKEKSYGKTYSVRGDEQNTAIRGEGYQIFSEGSSPVYIPNNYEQNGARSYKKLSSEDERISDTGGVKESSFTSRPSPVYIPNSSGQRESWSYGKVSSENKDELKPDTGGTRKQYFSENHSPVYNPGTSEQSEVKSYSRYSEMPSNRDYEQNSDISGKGDQIFSEGSSPIYIPNNSGMNYKKISSEGDRNSDVVDIRNPSFILRPSPIYIPERSEPHDNWSYSKISSANEDEIKPDSGGSSERYFSDRYSAIYNPDTSEQHEGSSYNRYSLQNADQRYSEVGGKADRILALESSPIYSPENSERRENEEDSDSKNASLYPIQDYNKNGGFSKSSEDRKSSTNEGETYSDIEEAHSLIGNHEDEMSTQIEANEKEEGRANGNDAVASYYDFLINEGSYKFWAVFQVITAILLIYSAFAAIYYAKYTFSQMDYPDYLDDGFFFKRSGDFYATSTSTAKPESFTFLGLSPQTFQRIMNAISSKKYS